MKIRILKSAIAAYYVGISATPAMANNAPVGGGRGDFYIQEGTDIKTDNANTSVTGITVSKNDNYAIENNGAVNIAISTEDNGNGSVTGVKVTQGGTINLGSNSGITVNNNLTTATGLNVSGSAIMADGSRQFSHAEANNLDVAITGNNAKGMDIQGGASVKLTGENNISVTGKGSAANNIGVNIQGQQNQISTLNAENLTINTNSYGFKVGNNASVTLTGNTTINSGLNAVWVTGGNTDGYSNFSAETLTVTTTGRGDGAVYASTGGNISIGAGSSIKTQNMIGLFANSDPGYTVSGQKHTAINFDGSQQSPNTIQVGGQAGVWANGDNSEININHTNIIATADNYDVIGMQATDGGIINAQNTTISVSDNGTECTKNSSENCQSIAAVRSSAGSVINFSGDIKINAEQTHNQLALYTTGDNAEINIKDSAVITGNVLTAGNNNKIQIDLNGGRFTGMTGFVTEGTNETGSAVAYTGSTIDISLTNNSQWNMTNDSEISSLSLNNGSVLNLNTEPQNPGAKGNTLTVNGDYTGNDGLIVFNTQLEGDDSLTDRLIIQGNTSGNTQVRVDNMGGQGAETVNGIKLISVNGVSDGEFQQSGRIVAGVHEYSLARGNNNDQKNWYLTNITDSQGNPVVPGPDSPSIPGESGTIIRRPEAAGYIANIYQANNIFNLRLHDRPGETAYTDVMSGEKKVSSMWLRNIAGRTNTESTDGQLKTGSNRYILQLGGDIAQWSDNDVNSYRIGLVAGYGRVNSTSANKITGYRATSHTNGYSGGTYGTYYANDKEKTGLYIDSWMLYNWFDNTVDGEGLQEEKYNAKGLTASVESGYTFQINDTTSSINRWYIQPKAQLTYSGVKMDNHTEVNGTRVSGAGENNIQTRLGMKAFWLERDANNNTTDRTLLPFAEVNWIHNTKNTGVTMDGDTITHAGIRNIGELKVGLEGRLTENTEVHFNIAQQTGSGNYSDTQGMMGIRIRF